MRAMRPSRTSPARLLAVALTLLAASCQDLPVSPEPAQEENRPFYNGVFLGDADSNPERMVSAIRGFASLSGKHPALVKTFHPVSCDFSPAGWCGQVLRRVVEAGSTNYVALDPRWSGAPGTGLLGAIAAGAADAELRRIARQLASLGAPVLLEPAWEMNGNWSYAWQGASNGGGPSAPASYVAAWRRMVEIFRQEGAANVRWVFNPNAGNPFTYAPTGASHWNWYAHYYPGDAYVDYVGAHGFNAPRVWDTPWLDFATLFEGASADYMLSDLARRYPDKPIIIGEFASDEGEGDAKARWIEDAFRRLQAHPNVVGAVWFHMDKEARWRVDSSAASLAAYQRAVAHPGVGTAFQPGAGASASRLAGR